MSHEHHHAQHIQLSAVAMAMTTSLYLPVGLSSRFRGKDRRERVAYNLGKSSVLGMPGSAGLFWSVGWLVGWVGVGPLSTRMMAGIDIGQLCCPSRAVP